MQRSALRGSLLIGGAAILWGASASLGRAVFTGRLPLLGADSSAISPLLLSQSRTTISCLILAVGFLLLRRKHALQIPLGDIWRFAALGVVGIAASNFLYYFAVQRTTVATAIVLQYSAPAWVLIYSIAAGLERPTWVRALAVALAMLGIALVIRFFHAGSLNLDRLGVAAALLAAIAFAFYNVAGHNLLHRYDHWVALLHSTLWASLFWLIVNPPWKVMAAHLSVRQAAFLLIFAISSMLAPFGCYFAGLRHLSPVTAIIASCLEPVFTILIAAFALGERIALDQVAGIALVLAAIGIIQSTLHSVSSAEV